MIKCVKKRNILEAVQYDGSAASYDRVEKFVAHHARAKYAVCGVLLQGRIPGTSYLGKYTPRLGHNPVKRPAIFYKAGKGDKQIGFELFSLEGLVD